MTEITEIHPETQTFRLLLDPAPTGIARHVEQAAEHLHYAICASVGSSQGWRESTSAHRVKLRATVIDIIEGTR